MTTPKQRAAKAVDEAGEKWLEQNPCGDIDINDWATVPRGILVDAVLAAIAAPSEAMAEAGGLECASRGEARVVWRKMHAALVAEKE